MTVLERDPDAAVRGEASQALADRRDRSALPALRRALEIEPDAAVREVLEESIADLSTEQLSGSEPEND
jgi:hypothetical protein